MSYISPKLSVLMKLKRITILGRMYPELPQNYTWTKIFALQNASYQDYRVDQIFSFNKFPINFQAFLHTGNYTNEDNVTDYLSRNMIMLYDNQFVSFFEFVEQPGNYQ